MASLLRASGRLSRTSRGQLTVFLPHNGQKNRRWQSSNAGSTSQPESQPSQLLRLASIVAAIGVGAAGTTYITNKDEPQTPAKDKDGPPKPAKRPVQKSPRALSLQQADAKLSRYCGQVRASGYGKTPVVHFCSLPSNSPTEDRVTCMIGEGVAARPTLFAAVFDGHAGYWTAQLLSESLLLYTSAALSQLPSSARDEDIVKSIKSTFVEYDDELTHKALHGLKQAEGGDPDALEAALPATSGSCATVGMYDVDKSEFRLACAGDSRAVLGSWSSETATYTAEALSKDQTGFNKDEVERITAAHPGEDKILDPATGRLLGMAVTRAFGDHRYKWSLENIKAVQEKLWGTAPRPDYKSPPYMTAEPEVTTRTVKTADFAILASDGLWDLMSNEDAVACVSRWLKARKNGSAEPQASEAMKSGVTVSYYGSPSYRADPDTYAIEDLDNAAKCLVKNALGGRRRSLFRSLMSIDGPASRYARDDISVQVIFFGEDSLK